MVISESRPWIPILETLLGESAFGIDVFPPDFSHRLDDQVLIGKHVFLIDCKESSDAASVAAAIARLESAKSVIEPRTACPLLVVTHMGATGEELCRRADIAWIDLAGNAQIVLPGVRIVVRGKGKAPTRRGRKSDAFATKSSRVAHFLLLHPKQRHTQGEIADATKLGKGFVSRIVAKLEELRLVRRVERRIELLDYGLMIKLWERSYEIPGKRLVAGVVPSRSGQETVELLSKHLTHANVEHVFGGLAAAWLHERFADFRLATCHVRGAVDRQMLGKLGFVETERGANVWLAEGADEVAFMGKRTIDGTSVASRVFTYIDLSAHPERASDAAGLLLEAL